MTIDFPAINIVAVIIFCQSVQPPPFPEIFQKFKQGSLNYQYLGESNNANVWVFWGISP